MMEFLQTPLILFLTLVAPIWIISHYVTKWRTAKILSAEDEKMLQELWELTPKLQSRINTLERILDAEAPEWRKQV
ncbi:MAG: envelope stress response membrane protein PspB [Defluviicoccus sp.]